MSDCEFGCQVDTPYGRGNVVEVRDHNKIVVELDEWKLAGGTHPLLHTESIQVKKCSFCDIGTCVFTRYGPGIVFNVNRITGIHTLRMWRPRGLGAATAHVNLEDILHTMKAFPGLEVETIFGKGMVESYSEFPSGREYGKYIVHLPFGLAYLNEDSILCCPDAKVLPVAESLADKALSKIKWTQWGESVYNSASGTPVWSSVTSFWDRLRSGETKIDEAVAERARQLNEHIAGIDLEDMHNQLQNRLGAIVSEPGKIELLLSEGKDRLLQLIENAESRDELSASTRSTLEEYLRTGRDQLDKALDDVRGSSSDNERRVIDSITNASQDLSGSLSVMRNLAESDPVLQDLVKQLDDVSVTVKNRSNQAADILSTSKTVQVLETGRKNLTQRLENLLGSSSSDVSAVKGFGEKIVSTFEQQGATAKGKALLQSVRDRISKKIAVMDADKSIAHTIEEKLTSMLSSWKAGIGQEATAKMTAQLSQLTVLLTMIGEGSMSVDRLITTTQSKIMNTLNDPAFRRSSEDTAREKLLTALVAVKHAEERFRGKKISGFKFYQQFFFEESNLSMQETLSTALGDITKTAEFRGIVESLDSPLLNDVTAPMSRIVAQIRSGEFDIEEAIQAAKESLDSDILQSSAAELVAKGEKVVSVLESFRSHDAVKTVLTHIQDMDLEARITSGMMNFDADSVLSEAEATLTDAEARNRMLNTTKDKVLGFLLNHIPNMSIPDIQGVKDDVQFAVTRLDLSGFKLKKEDVTVTVGRSVNEEFLCCEARNISAAFNSVRWKYQQLYFPYLSGNGVADAAAQNASIKIGFKLVRVPKGIVDALAESAAASLEPGYNDGTNVYARFPAMEQEVERLRGELLVSSRDIANRLQRAGSLVKGRLNGSPTGLKADSEDKPSIWGDDVTAWEPVLIMSSRTINMNSLNIKIDDSSLSWLYNLLASVFTGVIRDYVCSSLKDMLGQQSASLLGSINSTAVTYWPMLHKILKVDLVVLKEANAADVAALIGPPKPTGGPTEMTPREYVMKFAEDGPLGMQLDIFKTGKHVQSGPDDGTPTKTVFTGTKVVITGAVPNSQAERVFAASGVQPYMHGATIASVNGKTFKGVDEDGVLALLRGSRPLYIAVRLSMAGWEKLGIHKSILAKERSQASISVPASGPPTAMATASAGIPANKRKLRVMNVLFDAGPLGLKLKETKSCGGAVIITGFSTSPSGEPLQAEKSGVLEVGMVMLAVEGQVVFGRPFDDVMAIVKAAKRPMNMTFVPSPDKQFTFDAPPNDLVLGRIEGFVMIAAFKSEVGPAQLQGGMSPGMVILQVNRVAVTSEATPEDVEAMMNAPFTAPPVEGGKPAKAKLAVRDMDAFMHLIRIRDGIESVSEVVEIS